MSYLSGNILHNSESGVSERRIINGGPLAYAGELARYIRSPSTIRVRVLERFGRSPSVEEIRSLQRGHQAERELFRRACDALGERAGDAHGFRVGRMREPEPEDHQPPGDIA